MDVIKIVPFKQTITYWESTEERLEQGVTYGWN